MSKHLYLFAIVPVLLLGLGGVARAQHPILDQIASKVVQKYQNSSCEQLWQRRGQPDSPREQEVIEALRNNPRCALSSSIEWRRPSPTRCLNAV